MTQQNTTSPDVLQPEKAILGWVMVDNSLFFQLLDTLSRDDFSTPAHRIIFDSMSRIKDQDRHIGSVTVIEELEKSGQLKQVGGANSIALLSTAIPLGSDSQFSECCRIVKEKAIRRTLVNYGKELISRCSAEKDSVATLMEVAQTQLYDLDQRQAMARSGPRSIHEIATEAIPYLMGTLGEGGVTGTPTGFPRLDDLTGGWQEGELNILAARPSLGKSALALDLTRNLCQQDIAVGIFSLEMSALSLLIRLACRVGKIDSSRLRFGTLTQEERGSFLDGIGAVSKWPLFIDDSAGLGSEQLEWRIKSLAQREKPRLVIVDHMQLLHAKAENRTQEMTRISGGLQRAARELGKISKGTLLALSQLSRLAAGEEPQLHHLRESGAIEQDADVVMFLWDREEAEFGQGYPVERVLKIGKQRNGPTGVVPLLFIPTRAGFEEEPRPPEKPQKIVLGEKPDRNPSSAE